MWIYTTLVLASVHLALGFSCVCSPSECEPLSEEDCPLGAGTVWDPCGCCRVCARTENEPCGGPYGFYGSCGAGLECVVSDVMSEGTEGTCKRLPGTGVSCVPTKYSSGCNVVSGACRCGSAPVCPGDVSPYTFQDYQECMINLGVMKEHARQRDIEVGLNCTTDEDCDDLTPCPSDSVLDPIEGKCVCSKAHCSSLIACSYDTKLTKNGTGTPGDCCDIFECISPKELNCTGVVCDQDEIDCPSDSMKLPRLQNENECCSVPQGCECLPGPCQPPSCPPGKSLKLKAKASGEPGTCCPVFECVADSHKCRSPVDKDKEYNDGDNWQRNACTNCSCTKGKVQCVTTCPPLPGNCSASTTPVGQCCPICVHSSNNTVPASRMKPGGCKGGSGQIYKNGDSWMEDDCTYCNCTEGKRKCLSEFCVFNGTSVVTRPTCPSLTKCNLNCSHEFDIDENGCQMCKCRDWCPSMEQCTKKCKHGFSKGQDGCPLCSCYRCSPVKECKKRCSNGYLTDERGCQMCKCKPPQSTIVDCFSDGETRDDGESWFDGCRQCYCYGGKQMCALVACPKLDCPDSIVSTDSCCPSCPGGNETKAKMHIACYVPGGVKLEGEKWTEGCVECICHSGKVMCHKEVCPPLPCFHPTPPRPGSCCSTCPDKIQLPAVNTADCGVDRPAGSTWRQGSCVSCICVNGIANCYTESCDYLNNDCKQPLQLKNHCCPLCLSASLEETACQVGNETFAVGQEWEPKPGMKCSCGPGHTVYCMQTTCDSTCTPETSSCLKCKDGESHGGPWMLVYLGILVFVATFVVVTYFLCRYYQKRHKSKIYDAKATNYPYKYDKYMQTQKTHV